MHTNTLLRAAAALLSAVLLFSFSAITFADTLNTESSAPDISAESCVLIDAQTAQIVYAKNESQKRPMASTTKIMTTLLTLESGDLNTAFTVDTDAIHVEGSSMGLQEGDTVTKRALCVGMLLPSGNDAANAAAVAVAGSIPAFLDLMNARAKAIGMTRSWFASPSGLDAEGHGASAYDMALLAREALKNPDFAEICAQAEMTVSFGNPPYTRTLYNTNKLLSMSEDIIGIKTGFTDAAGRCLVSACTRDGRTLICVTLFDRNDWTDHLALYDYGFSLASDYTLPLPEQITAAVEGGDAAELALYAKEPLTLSAWRGIPPEVTYTVLMPPFLTAPIRRGDPVGEIVCTAANAELARLPLLAAKDIPAPDHNTDSEGLFASLIRRLKALFS